MARKTFERPTSYSTSGPAVTSDAGMKVADKLAAEKPTLSVEHVHAELRRLRPGNTWSSEQIAGIRELIDQLPRVDVVEDCILTARSELGHTLDGDKYITIAQRNFAKGVISRYLELRGLPADPELEGK